MFWDAEQTVSSTVRWYFVDDSTPFCPFPHRFSSEIWDQVHWGNDGAGEDPNSLQPYDKGALPTPFEPAILPGDVPCGPPQWWSQGAPSDAPPEPWFNGLPACCHARYRFYGCSCSAASWTVGTPVPSCGACALSPGVWLLSISDVVNAGCANCATLNGAGIRLVNIPAGQPNQGGEISNGCYWDSQLLPAPCSSGPFAGLQPYWEIQYSTFDLSWHLFLRVGIEMVAQWSSISVFTWNCFAANTFTTPTWLSGMCSSTAAVTVTPGH